MPLMKNIKFPANTTIYIAFIMDIANLDLVSTEDIDVSIYYLPETEAYNINFEACGVESTYYVSNIGSVLWIIYAYMLTALVSLLLFKVPKIWSKLGQKIYFNSTIRFFMELF